VELRLAALPKVLRCQGSHVSGLGPIVLPDFLCSMFVGSSGGPGAPTVAECPSHPILLPLPSRGWGFVRSNRVDGLGSGIDDEKAREKSHLASMSQDCHVIFFAPASVVLGVD